MDKCILEKIADELIFFYGSAWETESAFKPDNFDEMSQDEKDKYCKIVRQKLEEMLDDPRNTLFSWALDNYCQKISFEDWLRLQIEYRIEYIMRIENAVKNKSYRFPTVLKRIVNKVRESRVRKQVSKSTK